MIVSLMGHWSKSCNYAYDQRHEKEERIANYTNFWCAPRSSPLANVNLNIKKDNFTLTISTPGGNDFKRLIETLGPELFSHFYPPSENAHRSMEVATRDKKLIATILIKLIIYQSNFLQCARDICSNVGMNLLKIYTNDIPSPASHRCQQWPSHTSEASRSSSTNSPNRIVATFILPTNEVKMENGDVDIPNEYICPIAIIVMSDPVYFPYLKSQNKQCFERSAILKYLEMNDEHPLTREKISIATLAPNLTLKQEIDIFSERNKVKKDNNFSA